MKVIATSIPDVKILEPTRYTDERGFFMETWRQSGFDEQVTPRQFVQDNHARSCRGTLRGLHYQTHNTQGKLVRVVVGEVFDVAVDLRRHSSTFGQWVGVWLSAQNGRQLWIPEGFAHGFYVTSPWAESLYRCTDYYNPSAEHCLRWDDASLAIDWPLSTPPLLSSKDQQGLSLSEVPLFE